MPSFESHPHTPLEALLHLKSKKISADNYLRLLSLEKEGYFKTAEELFIASRLLSQNSLLSDQDITATLQKILNNTLHTYNPFTERAVNIIVLEKSEMGGGLEIKNRIKGLMLGKFGGIKEVKLVERQFSSVGTEDYDLSPVEEQLDKILSIWKAFKLAGLPVVPALRKTSEQSLIVTDLKTETNEIYGKGVSMWGEGMAERKQNGLSQTDLVYLQNYQRLLPDITQATDELIEKATHANLALPMDDACTLIMDKDGSWELMILDLGSGKDLTNPRWASYARWLEADPDYGLKEINQLAMQRFLGRLEDIFTKFNQLNQVTEEGGYESNHTV